MARPKSPGGRPSKGDRWPTYVRLPRELADLFQADAERSDLSYNDLMTNITAAYYGRPAVQQPRHIGDDELLLTA